MNKLVRGSLAGVMYFTSTALLVVGLTGIAAAVEELTMDEIRPFSWHLFWEAQSYDVIFGAIFTPIGLALFFQARKVMKGRAQVSLATQTLAASKLES